jgi:hypothetical protein
VATLRDRLMQARPDLHAALERSWATAHNEWLPALGPSGDSYNSYPHLRNLEGYLERLVEEHDSLFGAGRTLLSPLETFAMLAAILFHDIGRARPGKDNHGAVSQRIISHDYASLGIPSQALAESLGRIARFHSLTPSECTTWLRRADVRTVAISSYGEVRERVCSALLLLLDHLDSASTRVVPVYVAPSDRVEAKGAFRRAIQSVDIDLRARMVKVVLSRDLERLASAAAALGRHGSDAVAVGKDRGPDDAGVRRTTARIDWQWLLGELGLDSSRRRGTLTRVARGHLRTRRPADSSWPPEVLVAILLGDATTNSKAVEPVRTVLSAVGVSIDAWLLEVNERLFNSKGCETYEPIFNRAYLKRVARAMWDLSVRVFAHGVFSYDTLAAQVGEPDRERVRRAVCRLSIACKNGGRPRNDRPPWKSSWHCPFWVGREQWRWNVTPRSDSRLGCDYVALSAVDGVIDRLQSPHGENE